MNSPNLKPGDIVRLVHSEPKIVVVQAIVNVPLTDVVRFTWVHYEINGSDIIKQKSRRNCKGLSSWDGI